MKILIADDDPTSVCLLQGLLRRRGYEVVTAADGRAAWDVLRGSEAPPLAVLDWHMPGLDGPSVCRMLRTIPGARPAYLVLLTGNSRKEDVSAGLRAGADDYVIKPFDREEFLARIQAGARIVKLQRDLTRRVSELEEALARVKQLQGLLPVCCYCQNVRDGRNDGCQDEPYTADPTALRLSHGICPECYQKVVQPQLAAAGISVAAQALGGKEPA
jgi:DNA-binding response OmpR family regulator